NANTGIHPSRFLAAVLVAVALLAAASDAGAQALRRNLSSYLLLTMKRASLKNMRIGSPCNVGVNCGSPTPTPHSPLLPLGRVPTAAGGRVGPPPTFPRRPGGQVWPPFRNDAPPPDNVTLVGPPPNPQPFDPPIIPGTCDADCNPDYAAMKVACGFPSPFPTCDRTKAVRMLRGSDCAPYDTVPGNKQCDLPPGTYGSLLMANGARLNLQPGSYVLCQFRAGQHTITTGHGTTILLPPVRPPRTQ